MTPEGKVKKKIRELLNWFKCWFFAPVSNGMGKHGVPDYITCVPVIVTPEMVGNTIGLFVAIEAKKENVTDATDRQKTQMKAIRKAGGVAILINMERIPNLEDVLIKMTGKRGKHNGH